jgi:sporulation protein YlmC with PRC-barrel domain
VALDDGYAVHFTELKRGTPVVSSDGQEVGTLAEVLDNYRENIMDGLVVETPAGERKFVDAPEVERTAERAVTLNITAAQVEALGPPPSGGGSIGSIFRRRR